jgi:RecA/RadA recombinase
MAARKSTAAKTTRSSRKATSAKASGKTTKRKTKEQVAEEQPGFYDLGADLDELQDDAEKKFGLVSSVLERSADRMSTGILALDLLLYGGIVGGGWYTLYGPEQSAKSTLAMTILGQALDHRIRNESKFACGIFDYEGSVDEEYTGNIMKALGVKGNVNQIFGVRGDDTNWEIPPLARYYAHDVGEDFFKVLGKVKRGLPEKQIINGEAFYLFEHTQANKKKFAGMYDTKYLTRQNKIKVPAKDGFMQALYLCDSYPAMLPQGLDDDDRNDAMAEQARMFAAGIKKVKGGMRKKGMTVIGINQLRLRPATMFGNPEYEPCGEALKFFSDVRIKSTPRSSAPYHFALNKGICEEKSATHSGKDTYRFLRLKTTKNKLGGMPQQECWARIWVSDATGEAKGIDPAFDTYEYLKLMGFVSGTKANFKFHEDCPLHGFKKCTWDTFKSLVIASPKEVKEICQEGGIKPVKIREWCKKHCSSGKGPKRFKELLVAKADKIDDDDD